MTAAERAPTLDALKPYPAYKDSGVEWIGDIPKGWSCVPIKKGYAIQLGKMLQPQAASDASLEVEYLRAANVQDGRIDVNDVKTMFMSPTEAEKFAIAQGDLLILEGGEIGRSALVPAAMAGLTIQNSLHRVRGISGNTRFLHYAMQHIRSTGLLDVLCNKATIQHLTGDKLAALVVPQPQAAEQVAISTFLDHETARIDALVREQELLLEDLAEKRQATVNHATLAATPVDSTQLPAGWRNVTLKTLLTSFEQGWSPQCDNRPATEGEWGVMKVGCVNGHTFNAEENKALPSDLDPIKRYALKYNDVLVSRANTRDLVGSAARVDQDYPSLLLCDKLYRLRTDEAQLRPAYLVLMLNSPIARAAIETSASGASASMVNISQSTIRNLVFPIPPANEQDDIIAHLDLRLAQIDALGLEVRANIEDMKLLRSTLITAATTGKIDVRNWRPA